MSKWKCEICGKEFDNFQAQGFDNKVYCPLCFFKEKTNRLEKRRAKLKEENQQLKEVIEEVRGYANEKIKFNDDQIKEYKTCITTNINGKFPKEVKENMEHSMTLSMCINYKLKNIVQILDKVKEVK